MTVSLFTGAFAALVANGARAQDITFTINATADRGTIPAATYGCNELGYAGATLNRHGGNRLTGFNWENNASNAGSDYIYHSDDYLGSLVGLPANTMTPGAVLQKWRQLDSAAGEKTLITLPIAGYVAADMNGTVQPSETAPSARWKAVVADKPGALSLTPDSTDGNVYLEEMVNWLVANYGTAANGGIFAYNLDNEPGLWNSTHVRLHPTQTTYTELASKGIAAAQVTTALDGTAEIWGPTSYGWGEYVDLQSAPDAGTYNGTYGNFCNWYLSQFKSASTTAGRRLLHRYDIHWYPEARGDHRIVFEIHDQGTNNDIDARLQAPRSLWDTTYTESSWITQYSTLGPIKLLPRIQSGIDAYYPGTGIAISEYNFGGTNHISGAVAQADVLGILGRYQAAGCYWPLESDNTYVAAAFRLYRNYDGAGSAFGNISLGATASNDSYGAAHAARVGSGGLKLTVVSVNRSRTTARSAQFNLTLPADQALASVKAYRLDSTGGSTIQALGSSAVTISGSGFSHTLPAMSATLYEIQLVNGYAAWQRQQFGANYANAAISGDTADPDNDGVANGIEYLLGRNPVARENAAPFTAVKSGANGVQVQFDRRKGITDSTLLLQATPGLSPATWQDYDSATLNPVKTNVDANTERWTFTFSTSGAQYFFRLKSSR